MEKKKFDELYSDLLVHSVGLQPDDRLIVRGDTAFWDFYCELAKAAYKKGAKHVDVWNSSDTLTHTRLEHSNPKNLSYQPSEIDCRNRIAIDENAVFIRISTSVNPFIFEDIDSLNLGILMKSYTAQRRYLLSSLMADRNRWLVASYPCEEWARIVLGENGTYEDLQRIVLPILFGPENKPVEYWEEKSRVLEQRCNVLNKYGLKSLHITGGGTDLSVGLSRKAIWTGGQATQVPEGSKFLPNLPTEEVFTAPDWRKTNGTAKTSRSVIIQGNEVIGAEFHFEDGILKKWDAEKGKETLDSFFGTDEGSKRLGEVSIVGSESPVYQANRLFFDTLLDENAAVHIAFGSGYITNLEEHETMTDKEKEANGLSQSDVHEDVMIGCDDTRIEGEAYDGTRHVLMEDGRVML